MWINCHSYFSYKYGTLSLKQLFAQAATCGFERFVLTDINSTSAVIDFIRLAPENGVHPVVGIDFRNGAEQKYIGIARNNNGFRELNEHLTEHSHAEQPFENRAPEFSNAYVVYPWNENTPNINSLRDNEYIGIRPSQVNKLLFSDIKHKPRKLVVLAPVTFASKKDFNAHRLLRAIDKNLLLSMLPKSEESPADEMPMSEDELRTIFIQFPGIIKNTKALIGDCTIHFNFSTNKNKKQFLGSNQEDFDLIREEVEKGLMYRYGTTVVPSNVRERIDKELKLIRDLDFCAYFLINWDMVNYARSQNYFYVGRGSGANSMVAYLLRITDVDPIELDLYFERFINPYRTNPPDFDIDFSSYERNDVTRYLFEKHGNKHTALVGAYNTFQGRAVVRQLGKVFGMPADEIDKLQRAKNYSQVDEIGQLVLKYTDHIQGFPAHLSVHSSGVIISDLPISTYTATMMPPKGFPTIHFSMLEAEDVGLHKFDVLGQRGLGKIKDTLEIIRGNRKPRDESLGNKIENGPTDSIEVGIDTELDFDIHDINRFKKDPEIRKYLKAGDAIGCFYVESPAMRMLLTKLRAEDYLRLVAASSIIRPGVAQSGMMNEYINRFHHPELREKARNDLPELYDILHETFGVMVYQEDVIKVAHYFADLPLSEADILRRGMSWKFRERSQFDLVKKQFFDNCIAKGHSMATIQGIWTQIESFANYAFSKGHSASYAVESYQALFLKVHYPLEYMVATLNNGGGFYRADVYLHEAKKYGGQIELPCINRSEGLCVIYGKEIFIGLGFISTLEVPVINAIRQDRMLNGDFKNLRDFLQRICISLEQLRPLIRIGAFRFTGKSKKELLWDAHFLLSESKKTAPEANLFEVEVKEFTIPELWSHELEDAYDEMELIGYPIHTSPFAMLREIPDLPLLAKDIPANIKREVTMLLYLVNTKYTQTLKGVPMNFGTWYDQQGAWVDTVHFPDSAANFPFRGPGCYVVKGMVMEEYGFITINVSHMERVAMKDMEAANVRLKPASVTAEERVRREMEAERLRLVEENTEEKKSGD